jgi:hypothetical protein
LQLDVLHPGAGWPDPYRNLSRNDREDDHGEEAEEVEDEGEENEARRPGAQEEESSESEEADGGPQGGPEEEGQEALGAAQGEAGRCGSTGSGTGSSTRPRAPANAGDGSAIAGDRHRRLGRRSQDLRTIRPLAALAAGGFVLVVARWARQCYSAAMWRTEGVGTGRPSARASSIQALIASRTFESASSGVSPSDMQPGKSGTVATKPPPSSPASGSIMTA